MGSWRVATDARTAAGAFTAPKMAAAASSAAPTVSVLRRRTRNRGRGTSLFPRFSLRLKYKNIRISSPFYFGRGYAIIFSFMPWTLCTSFGFFKLGSPFECGMAPSPQVPQSFLHRFSLYCFEKVKTKLQKFIKNSSKTRDAFLENGFCGPEAQYFTGIVIDPVFDLLDRFRCDFPEVCSFQEPTADHSIHIFV